MGLVGTGYIQVIGRALTGEWGQRNQGRGIWVLFLCPHSPVSPRAPPIYQETIFREYRGELQPILADLGIQQPWAPFTQ